MLSGRWLEKIVGCGWQVPARRCWIWGAAGHGGVLLAGQAKKRPEVGDVVPLVRGEGAVSGTVPEVYFSTEKKLKGETKGVAVIRER